MTTTINNENKKRNFSNEREQSQACLNSAEHETEVGHGECRGKAFQAIISMLFPTEGCAALAPGYLHRQAMCTAFQAGLCNFPDCL